MGQKSGRRGLLGRGRLRWAPPSPGPHLARVPDPDRGTPARPLPVSHRPRTKAGLASGRLQPVSRREGERVPLGRWCTACRCYRVGSLGETEGHFFSGTEENEVSHLKWWPEQVEPRKIVQGLGIGNPCPELEDKIREKRMDGGRETAKEATAIDPRRMMGG